MCVNIVGYWINGVGEKNMKILPCNGLHHSIDFECWPRFARLNICEPIMHCVQFAAKQLTFVQR